MRAEAERGVCYSRRPRRCTGCSCTWTLCCSCSTMVGRAAWTARLREPYPSSLPSAELGNMLLHCPRQFWSLLQQLCHTAVTALGWLPSVSSPSQLLLILRLSSLPSLPGYSISRPSDLPPLAAEPRFLEVRGVVVAASLPSKYT